ncbi:MAG: hypothetical protein ACM3XS_07740 [Bacteroidota bacterium]
MALLQRGLRGVAGGPAGYLAVAKGWRGLSAARENELFEYMYAEPDADGIEDKLQHALLNP